MTRHLQKDVTFEEALERLRERSVTLAPAARNWDPDIADLLELTLNSVSVSYAERQKEIARPKVPNGEPSPIWGRPM